MYNLIIKNNTIVDIENLEKGEAVDTTSDVFSIDSSFFQDQKFTSLTIGKNIAYLKFDETPVTYDFVYVDEENPIFAVYDNCIYTKNYKKLIKASTNIETLTLHENTKHIEPYALLGCKKLTKINFNKNLRIIGDYSFKDCTSLKKVHIPKKVKEIGKASFENCKNLKKLTQSHKINMIDSGLIAGCNSLRKIIIPEGVMIMEVGALYNAVSLKHVYLPRSIRLISDCALPIKQKVILHIKKHAKLSFDYISSLDLSNICLKGHLHKRVRKFAKNNNMKIMKKGA